MSIRVVIIEDEYYTRQAIRKYIGRIGVPYEVCGEAGNGQDGLEFLRREHPDVALVDITMPVMDGIEMIEAARRESIATEIIILTGYSEFSYAQAAVQLGVCDYLLKPLRVEELAKGLERAVKLLHRQQETRSLKGLDVRGILGSQLAEQLMYGGPDSVETGLLLEYLSFPADMGVYYVALVRFYGEDARVGRMLKEISEAVQGEAAERSLRVLIGTSDERSLYLVINVPADFLMEQMLAFLSGVGRLLHAQVGMQVKIAVSRGSKGLESIRGACLDAQMAQRLFLFGDGEDVAVYTNDIATVQPSALLTPEMRREFTALLQAGAPRPVLEFIDRCFQWVGRASTSSNAMYLFVAELIAVMIEFRNARGEVAEETQWENGAYPALFSIDHVDALRQRVREFAEETLRRAPDQGAYAGLVRNIRKYIDDNCANAALRLEDIAHANAISIQHMCAVYRRAAGGTIGDYILEVRMARAKKLIAEGQRNVTAIAEACGYEDPGYFGKCFRKSFGMTPRQYIEISSK